MPPDEIDNAIAAHLGWTKIYLYEDNAGPPIWCGMPPASFTETFRKEKTYGGHIPNYCGSLDVVQGAFATLNEHYKRLCLSHVVAQLNPGQFLFDATALQWSKAFIRATEICKS